MPLTSSDYRHSNHDERQRSHHQWSNFETRGCEVLDVVRNILRKHDVEVVRDCRLGSFDNELKKTGGVGDHAVTLEKVTSKRFSKKYRHGQVTDKRGWRP